MSRRTGSHGKAGATGQHFRATPSLPEYDVAPAGPVTVTAADGSSTTLPAAEAKFAMRPNRRRRGRPVVNESISAEELAELQAKAEARRGGPRVTVDEQGRRIMNASDAVQRRW